jgi:hypothetical protein
MNTDSFDYALENTRVILAPQRQIETFGSTIFRFYLISELMDSAGEVRVRDGKLHAERPQIVAPGHYSRLMLEGFGEKARGFVEWLESHSHNLAIMKYGFQFRKSDVVENIVRTPLAQVVGNITELVKQADDPLSAIIQGVDDAWEVCLLKFTVDLIQKSSGGNLGDFRKRGLI